MRKNDKRSNRFLAVFLAIVMVIGLVIGFDASVPVRAAEAETTEEAAPAEKTEQEVKEEVAEETAADSEETDSAESEDKAEETGETENKEEAAESSGKAETNQDSGEGTGIVPGKAETNQDSGEGTGIVPGEAETNENSEEGTDIVSEEEEKEDPEAIDEKSKEPAFADLTPEEQYKALLTMTEKEAEEAISSLNEEQLKALTDYIENLPLPEKPRTVVFTNAGPFKDPVSVGRSKGRKLRTASKAPAKGKEPPEGLEMSKKATSNGDGTYTIELETYTTGEVTSQEISVPVDIVLVLDQSGSMAYDFSGNSSSYANSRQKAMKDAVVNFIDSVHEQYSENADHRISIVTFGTNASDLIGWTYVDDSGASTLTSSVNGLPQSPSGATNVAAGMGRAQHLVTDEYNYTGDNTTRQKVVVVFTDGVPTKESDFNTGVANGALNASQNIKNAGATVYTVGIFGGADPDELYGASGYTQNSNGTVGSRWYSSRILWFGDVDKADIPAGNRFLNYLSSNFSNVSNIGLTVYNRDYVFFAVHGWDITANASRTTSGYYLTADDSSSLNNVFQSIASQISTPTISLGTDTVIKDIISPQFQLPENATVKFYTQNYNGNNSWGTKTQITDSSVHLVETGDNKNVSATGFDFDANCVTEDAKEDGTHGKKLIIEITVEPDPNFLGGNVNTNGDDSGVVSGGETIANFTVDPVDVPLKKLEAQLTDKNIYLSTEDKLAEIFNKADQKFTVSNADGNNSHEANFEEIFNGENNAAVDVTFEIYDGATKIESFTIPHGETSGNWSSEEPPVLTADSYTIKCVVTDIKNTENATTGTETANINVFKPIITYEDKNVYYKGQQIPKGSIAPTKIEWKNGETLDTEVTMDTGKPTLTYEYSGITDGTVDQTTDYTVSVTKVMSDAQEDYDLLVKAPDEVTFLRDCDKEELDDEEASASKAFKIHVYMPSYEFADMEKYYGETISFTAPDPTWDNDGVTMNNDKPEFTVTLTPASGAVNENDYVAVKEDFDVAAVIKAGNTDITSALISAGKITRTCDIEGEECGDNPEVTASKAFVVHVKTITLDVEKKIAGLVADLTKTYNFTVTVTPAPESGLPSETKSQALGNKDKLEMDGLPKGATFTITETSVPENYSVTAKVNGEDASVTDGTENGAKVVTGTLTADENHIIVTNKLEEIPLTGINVPVIYLELLIIFGAVISVALIALRVRRNREIRNR